MESIKTEHLNFTYPNRSVKALTDINLSVRKGEFVLVCGKSGCGKSTLLRMLKPSLSPFGNINGSIYFDGRKISELDAKTQSSEIGFVMQDCDNQIVTDKVWHELSFGLESLGYGQSEIRTRVAEMASFLGIQSWFYKKTTELSGGQKQLLNLASVMVMQPSVLILDEPTSQLDPITAGEFLKTIERINRELGITVIISEHRLEDVFAMADRVIVMDEGRVIADEAPTYVGELLKENKHDMYNAMPTPIRVHGQVANTLVCPVTVRDGRMWLEEYADTHALNKQVIPKDAPGEKNDTVIEIKDAYFRYHKDMPDAVKGLELSVFKGELFCLVGGNGTGKSTALSLIAGINTPYRGEVLINGKKVSQIENLYKGLISVLPQNVQSVFVGKTVYHDLLDVLSETNFSNAEKEEKIRIISDFCMIEELMDYHPYDLSGGQQQRAALAKLLLTEPEILLLDEPTKGMDAYFKNEFAEILSALKANGVTILMVSHDVEFCAKYADRCALMFDGGITSSGAPREFFRGNSFYTTVANRMARTILPEAVIAEDIVLACGGIVEKKERSTHKLQLRKPDNKEAVKEFNKISRSKQGRKPKKSTAIAVLIILLLVPLTLFVGTNYFGSRKYYLTSFLIIIETMIPFFALFEIRKPKARELVVISVLCALAVIGRAAFAMFPQFKPTTALIIIAGVCFGCETGFLVGAVTGFVSNFFLGQGPWTPWQMFAFGIIGFVSGIVFRKITTRKHILLLSLFGFIATFVIYGGIMNPASVIMWQNKITWEMIAASYASGFVFDIIHSASTAIFLLITAGTMTEKLGRIKQKYGLIE